MIQSQQTIIHTILHLQSQTLNFQAPHLSI